MALDATYWQMLILADEQGTKEPICAMVTIAPSARIKVDLPPTALRSKGNSNCYKSANIQSRHFMHAIGKKLTIRTCD